MIIRREHLIAPITCKPNDSAMKIAQELRDANRRHIIVIDNDESPLGIISVRDLNNKIIADGKNPLTFTAKDLMTNGIKAISSTEGYDRAFMLMEELGTTSIPILEDGKIYGILEFSKSFQLRTLESSR
jgi:CBS domain-containing protein